MSLVVSRWSRSFVGLALLLGVAAVVWGAKPAPAPPPAPPPIKFNLKLFPTVETGTTLTMDRISSMNEAGDAVGHYSAPGGQVYPRVYLAGTVLDANDLLLATERESWTIKYVNEINNSFQILVHATYQGGTGDGLVPGAVYYCLLDINPTSQTVGTLAPIVEVTLGGTVTSVGVYSMNDLGVICGQVTAATRYAFVMAPGDAAPTYLFEDPSDLNAVYSQALDINNWGEVVGRRDGKGFHFKPDESVLYLGRIDTGRNIRDINTPWSINDSGVFAGYAEGAGGSSYAYRYMNNAMVKVTTTPATAKAINERNDVIYRYSTLTPYFYMDAENKHVNLITTGVVQGVSADVTLWRNNYPTSELLNESRVIAGFFDTSVARVAFILTPVP
jgi:hypothetical protein